MASNEKKSTANIFDKVKAWFGESRNTILFVIGFLLAWEVAVIVFKIPR
jgi:hypothetical protein